MLARAWAAGSGPGDDPLTIDLDSTVCETYGLCKEGAQRHNYAGQRGYRPLLAVAAGTGHVLMARLRKGRANTARGAANFLRETVSRVRHAGATGPLTVRADSGFYTHGIMAACRDQKVRYSITVRQHPQLRNLIEAIPVNDKASSPATHPDRRCPRARACSTISNANSVFDRYPRLSSGTPAAWHRSASEVQPAGRYSRLSTNARPNGLT